ncbi:hypothetical protein QW060_25455 [Myroides ceti]|uniref:Uncharacterized protein n=1 Tax=Paenimyroides ceti TaxID=395087 RepID=A0ABT8D064_9FLAO|nr:hypothetical protein [Paenimyroides ceti]MDN3710218.1 hypothetical protein [Paenimyroides ceti]
MAKYFCFYALKEKTKIIKSRTEQKAIHLYITYGLKEVFHHYYLLRYIDPPKLFNFWFHFSHQYKDRFKKR